MRLVLPLLFPPLCAVPTLQAQTAAPAAPSATVSARPAVELPFPSEAAAQAHRIELALVGGAPGTLVRVLEAPSWLSWEADRVPVRPDGVAALTFRVMPVAPVGATETVRLGVMDPAGRLVAERAYRMEVAAPSSTDLKPVSPNPVGASADVRYVLAEPSRVRLTVYDGLGREVARLATGVAEDAGAHTARLDGSALASGLYVVRLVAEGQSGRVVALTRSLVRVR